MNRPLVTVIITTYNTDNSLRRAIESVKMQSYYPIEVIVVDDNNPNTHGRYNAEILMNSYKDSDNIVYIQHEKNKNGAAARNTGIRRATGEYIAFLDDDDEFYPERVERCVTALEMNADYVAVYTSVCLGLPEGKEDVYHVNLSGFIWRELLLDESLIGTGSNLFLKRSAVLQVNGFDESFKRYQDIEFMLRVLQNNRILALNEVLVKKNICDRNTPNYRSYKRIKEQVFSTFSYLIDQLSETERNNYYIHNYKVLLNMALSGDDISCIKQAAEDLRKYRPLTWKETINIQFPIIWRIWNYLKLRLK